MDLGKRTYRTSALRGRSTSQRLRKALPRQRVESQSLLYKPCIPLRVVDCFLSSTFGFFNFFGLLFFTSSISREFSCLYSRIECCKARIKEKDDQEENG